MLELLYALGWPRRRRNRQAVEPPWRWVAGTADRAVYACEEEADETAQAHLIDARSTVSPHVVAWLFRCGPSAHLVVRDERRRLMRVQLPLHGGPSEIPNALREALSWQADADFARKLDPALMRQQFVDGLLRLAHSAPRRQRARTPGADRLADTLAWLVEAPRQKVVDLLSQFPFVAAEDTPTQRAVALTPQILEAVYEAVAWHPGGRRTFVDGHFPTRKSQGSFHTPTDLVFAMIKDALACALQEAGASVSEVRALLALDGMVSLSNARKRHLKRAIDALTIVDPSVGPGSFLAGAWQVLRRMRLALGLSSRLPPRALCGVDVSPLAVEVCRQRLALAGCTEVTLAVGNSLVDGAGFAWRRTFADVFARQGFDVVIGNPPYLRDSRKKNLDAADLRRRYRSATSHYDLYVLFMERALDIVRAGGHVCLLTSNRWLAQKYGCGIREVLLENRLRGVLDLRYRTFEAAAVQTSITLVQRKPAAANGRTVVAACTADDPLPSIVLDDMPSIPQKDLSRQDGSPIRCGLHREEEDIGERMKRLGTPLRDVALVTLGMVFHEPRPEGRRKADFLRAQRDSVFCTPLLDGEHVGRWQAVREVWLDYQPGAHREPRFPELFAAHKVLCRRIIGRHRIMAMVDKGGRFFSDNVVGVVPCHLLTSSDARIVRVHCTARRVEDSRKIDVDYLTALLNSRLIDWYYQKLLGFGMHLYPAHLKAMPVIVAAPAEQRALARLACEAADAQADRVRLSALEADIDERVERLYRITKAERTWLSLDIYL